jgi:hypothetical protein
MALALFLALFGAYTVGYQGFDSLPADHRKVPVKVPHESQYIPIRTKG